MYFSAWQQEIWRSLRRVIGIWATDLSILDNKLVTQFFLFFWIYGGSEMLIDVALGKSNLNHREPP